MSIATKIPSFFLRFVISVMSDIDLPVSPIKSSFTLAVCSDDKQRMAFFNLVKRASLF